MTIAIIIAALVNLINGFKNPNNLQNDLDDAVLALTVVGGIEPGTPFIGGALKFIEKEEASLANFNAGQAAVVATRDINGRTASLVVLYNDGAAGQSLGL